MAMAVGTLFAGAFILCGWAICQYQSIIEINSMYKVEASRFHSWPLSLSLSLTEANRSRELHRQKGKMLFRDETHRSKESQVSPSEVSHSPAANRSILKKKKKNHVAFLTKYFGRQSSASCERVCNDFRKKLFSVSRYLQGQIAPIRKYLSKRQDVFSCLCVCPVRVHGPRWLNCSSKCKKVFDNVEAYCV
jgi:hypothetical protein